MGEGQTGPGHEHDARKVTRSVTVEELERWREHGAIWRALELSDQRAVVELCTCYGEPVDMVASEARELIEYVRAHRGD